MGKFVRNISLFVAGFPLLVSRGGAAVMDDRSAATTAPLEPAAVSLRPLNAAIDNLFAGHRSHSSHSSHASHSSHYSGSGGGYSSEPRVPSTVNTFTPSNASPAQTPTPARESNAYPAPANPTKPVLSTQEMLKLQIMRVQIALTSLGLYDGPTNGILTSETQMAIRHFQTVKGIPETGMMTTPTLNALGVPAVN